MDLLKDESSSNPDWATRMKKKSCLLCFVIFFFFNSYDATIDCLEPRGCPIVVRISYHPAFVVKGKSSSRLIQTYSVSPSYLAFTVPFGIDDYTVTFQRPYWQKLLATLCFAFICLVGLSMMFLGSETKPKEIEKEKPKAKSE